MTATIFDCIVVGSGPAGVMCAQTLVEAGKNVLMIDAGVHDKEEDPGWTDNFTDIRMNSNDQESLFLGSEMELLNLYSDKAFGQMTPQRRYIVDGVLPVSSEGFELLESLATGGLGNAWGLGCFTFSDAELLKAKLNPERIRKAYEVVAERIGIAYTPDDILSYTADGIISLQPGIEVDNNSKAILERYYSRRKQINRQSFYAGVPALALLTNPKGERKATDYTNMDFYYNFGSAAYRPSVTIKYLQSYSNFVHQRGVIIKKFEENEDFVQVVGMEIKTNHSVQFNARNLVLACNVFGTARITLRSTGSSHKMVPVLSNAYSMVTTLQSRQLGKVPSNNKTSTAQVCLFFDENRQHTDVPMASLYSYSSLMLFRLLKKSPLNFRDSLRILQYLQTAIVIAGIHHPSSTHDAGYAYLDDNDMLKINYPDIPENKKYIEQTEKRFARVLGQLGCIPLKKISPPRGSSAHYAGTLPFSHQNAPLSISPQGLLSGTRHVFVADASGFHYLPAKGPTLTIMANAHDVALNICQR
jgi:choline dehydrogenase-like flavoprotein